MVRTVNSKAARSLNKGEHAVLLPGPTRAEPWEVWAMDATGTARCLQTCSSPLENRLRKGTVLALPVAQIFCLALWLNETDPKQFSGIISLQLELRGLQPRSGAAVFDWTTVAQEGTRTLVMIAVLPQFLPPELNTEAYEAFDFSARYNSFAENSVTLWREQDNLIVAFTRGPNLVYCQVLSDGQIGTRIGQDLSSIRSSLEMQNILLPLRQVVLWTDATQQEMATIQSSFQLPVKSEDPPLPQKPATPWKLIPATVDEAKKTRKIQRWKYRGFFIILAIYLVAVSFLAARFLTTSHKVAQLNAWQAEHAQAITLVRGTSASWKELQPAINQNQYPLELLFHASEAIPADQLHLTLFEAGEAHLLIKGEAKNVAAAFQFLDTLKSDHHFTGCTWNMSQPHLLPNDLAQLQIEGTFETSN